MPDIFLSYSREDQAIARQFATGLERAGFSVWWDQALHPGEAFDQVTEQALEQAKAVVVLWSKTSVQSRWVRAEATQAAADNRLVPVMIEPCKRPIMFELTHTAELSQWRGDDADPAWQAFVASLRRFARQGSAGTVPPVLPQVPVQRRSRTLPVALALAAILVAGIAVAVKVMGPSGDAANPAQAAAAPSVPTRTTGVSLALMPFEMRPADPAHEHFAEIIAERLQPVLGEIRGLDLTGLETTRFYKGARELPDAIAARLGVQYLLTATVRQEGDRLSVLVGLVDGRSSRTVESESFTGDLGNVDAMSEQVAARVAEMVGIKLDLGKLPRAWGGTTDVEAMRLYARAIEPGQADELNLLREVLRLDRQFHAARFRLYGRLRESSRTPERNEARRQEKEEHARILDEAPEPWQLWSGYKVLRMIEQRKWLQAQAAADHPGSGLDAKASFLISVGRLSESVTVLQRLWELNPGNLDIVNQQIDVLKLLPGRSGEADRLRDTAMPAALREYILQFDKWTDAIQPGGSKDPQLVEQLRVAYRELRGRPGGPPAFVAEVLAVADQPAKAMQMLRAALELPRNQATSGLVAISNLAEFFGDTDLALQAMRRDVVELGRASPLGVWYRPSLRDEPGFRQIVRDLGLYDYWRESGHWPDFCKARGGDDFECR